MDHRTIAHRILTALGVGAHLNWSLRPGSERWEEAVNAVVVQLQVKQECRRESTEETKPPQRYDLAYTGGAYSEHRDLVKHQHGDWCDWEDVEKALVAKDAEIEWLRERVEELEADS